MAGSADLGRAGAGVVVLMLLAPPPAARGQRSVEPAGKPLPAGTWQLRVGPFKMQKVPDGGALPLNGPVIEVSSSNGREYNTVERAARKLQLPVGVSGACAKGEVLTLAKLSLAPRGGKNPRSFPLSHGKRVLGEGWEHDTIETEYLPPGGRAADPEALCNQEVQRRGADRDARVALLKAGFVVEVDDAYDVALRYRCEPERRRKKVFEDAPDIDGTAGPVAASPVWVHCLPSARAGGPQPRTTTTTRGVDKRPGQALGDQPPIVQALELRPTAERVSGSCADGVRVTFRGAITVAAPSTIRYRYVGSAGYLSDEITLEAGQPGRYPTFWSWRVTPPAPKGLAATGGATGISRHEGWLRLEVRDREFKGAYSAGPLLSDIASFEVTCAAGGEPR
jgi:hypothetical protein